MKQYNQVFTTSLSVNVLAELLFQTFICRISNSTLDEKEYYTRLTEAIIDPIANNSQACAHLFNTINGWVKLPTPLDKPVMEDVNIPNPIAESGYLGFNQGQCVMFDRTDMPTPKIVHYAFFDKFDILYGVITQSGVNVRVLDIVGNMRDVLYVPTNNSIQHCTLMDYMTFVIKVDEFITEYVHPVPDCTSTEEIEQTVEQKVEAIDLTKHNRDIHIGDYVRINIDDVESQTNYGDITFAGNSNVIGVVESWTTAGTYNVRFNALRNYRVVEFHHFFTEEVVTRLPRETGKHRLDKYNKSLAAAPQP